MINQPIPKVHFASGLWGISTSSESPFCFTSSALPVPVPIRNMEGISREEEKTRLASSRHGNLKTAAGDENLKDIFHQIRTSKAPAVINYGASCQILPAFCQLSDKFPKLSFVYADIDECPETTQHIRYTPTFHFYRDGERVDEMYGTGEERLHDRLWLHS